MQEGQVHDAVAEQNKGGEILLRTMGDMSEAQKAVSAAAKELQTETAEIKKSIGNIEV